MYRMVIAEDETIIREGLAMMVDWEKLGFEIVACFEDGVEVIEYARENEIDVVLTDVKMYEVSGLDVARWMVEYQPNVIVVIISGYKEFDYVKEAIRSNVLDYILKPIDAEEILRVFQLVKEKLDKSKKSTGRAEEKGQQKLSADHMIERAVAYIDAHICEELTVESIAENVYMSRSHFARKFKECTGNSVMDFVIARRIEKAKEMIRSGERSQKKIAAAVGYYELQYFQRSFKKYTGFTVTEYQRSIMS